MTSLSKQSSTGPSDNVLTTTTHSDQPQPRTGSNSVAQRVLMGLAVVLAVVLAAVAIVLATVKSISGQTGATGAPGAPGATGAAGLGYTFRGPWSSGTSYTVNDTVTFGSNCFVCVESITGEAPAITSTTHWRVVARGITDRGSFSPDEFTTYHANDIVSYNDSSYICRADDTPSSIIPTTQESWTLLARVGVAGPPGNDGVAGPPGPPGPQGRPASGQGIRTWNNTTIYNVDDIVVMDLSSSTGNSMLNALYRASSMNQGNSPLTSLSWTRITTGLNDGGSEYIAYGNSISQSSAAIQSMTPRISALEGQLSAQFQMYEGSLTFSGPYTMTVGMRLVRSGRMIQMCTSQSVIGNGTGIFTTAASSFGGNVVPSGWVPSFQGASGYISGFVPISNGVARADGTKEPVGRVDIMGNGAIKVYGALTLSTPFPSGNSGFNPLNLTWAV